MKWIAIFLLLGCGSSFEKQDIIADKVSSFSNYYQQDMSFLATEYHVNIVDAEGIKENCEPKPEIVLACLRSDHEIYAPNDCLAIVHELVHAARLSLYGDWDAHHKSKDFISLESIICHIAVTF